MCELVQCHGKRVECPDGTTLHARKDRDTPERVSRAAVPAAFALVLGLITLAALSTYDVGRAAGPSDEELTANFLSHEARFGEFVQMLTADQPRLAVGRGSSIDLGTVARLIANTARLRIYKGLLQEISVEEFRYFPDSGKLVLVPDGEGNLKQPPKSYVYLPHAEPQSLAPYHGYTWRGAGPYVLSGDRPLKGSWFIHHDVTVEVAVAPY